ncbi:hypothetical protein M422DRAFT_774274, partial [Sphaerobolus stellatus SS14]
MVILYHCTCSKWKDLDREVFHSQRTIDERERRDRKAVQKRELVLVSQISGSLLGPLNSNDSASIPSYTTSSNDVQQLDPLSYPTAPISFSATIRSSRSSPQPMNHHYLMFSIESTTYYTAFIQMHPKILRQASDIVLTGRKIIHFSYRGVHLSICAETPVFTAFSSIREPFKVFKGAGETRVPELRLVKEVEGVLAVVKHASLRMQRVYLLKDFGIIKIGHLAL